MIKCEKGNIEVYGTENDLLAELSVIVKTLHKEIRKDKLEYAFKLSLMSSEELEEDKKLDEKIKNNKKELNRNIENFLKDLFGGNTIDI